MMRPHPFGTSADGGLRSVAGLVGDFSGLEFPDGRIQGLRRAVDQALGAHGLRTVDDLHSLLSHPDRRLDLEAFTASLTIGETHFFRNAPQFDALRTRVLPELIARHSGERRLRLWSAGCSTGEEAYSLAMLVDMLLPRREGWNVSILATDINRGALDRARTAIYGEWSFRQVPAEIKQRYFLRHDRRYHLASDIREMVTFGYLNLVEDRYPSLPTGTHAIDLILCRNVLIYFREDTINRVVERLEQALAPGGWLVAGHAESSMPIFRKLLSARQFPMSVIYRKRETSADDASTGRRPLSPARPAPAAAAAASSRRAGSAGARRVGERADRPPPEAAPATVGADGQHDSAADAVEPGMAVEDCLASAVALWRSGLATQAIGMLQDAADREHDDARPLRLAAKILASLRRLEPAENVARLALARDPLSPAAHYIHGLILQELGRRSEALEALRRCVYLDPASALGHYSLAALLAWDGQRIRADRAFATTIELVGDRPRDELIEDGDGLTVGRLLELAVVQRDLNGVESG